MLSALLNLCEHPDVPAIVAAAGGLHVLAGYLTTARDVTTRCVPGISGVCSSLRGCRQFVSCCLSCLLVVVVKAEEVLWLYCFSSARQMCPPKQSTVALLLLLFLP